MRQRFEDYSCKFVRAVGELRRHASRRATVLVYLTESVRGAFHVKEFERHAVSAELSKRSIILALSVHHLRPDHHHHDHHQAGGQHHLDDVRQQHHDSLLIKA